VSRLAKQLGERYRPERVVLFGSYGSRRQRHDSDLDLLIIKRTSKRFHERLFEVRGLAWPVLRGHPFDPIVLTPQEVERRLARGDQFVGDILRTGRVVYARP